MSHSYEELKKKTVAELREIAKGIEHEAVQGYTQLNKEHLLVAVCTALGLDMHVHHHAKSADKKKKYKKDLKSLKKERDAALEAQDPVKLKRARTRMRRIKKRLGRI